MMVIRYGLNVLRLTAALLNVITTYRQVFFDEAAGNELSVKR